VSPARPGIASKSRKYFSAFQNVSGPLQDTLPRSV
jgi:hypothetical protein